MKARIFITVIATLLCLTSFAEPPIEKGKIIFTARCAACHSVNKVLTGPALAGVQDRRSLDWIVSFVKSSQSLVKSGDVDAVAVFEKFNKIPMPDHADLTTDDVKSVVEFIKSESETQAATKAPFAKPFRLRPGYTPLSITDYGFFIGFFSVVLVLIAALLIAVQLKEYERNKGL